MIVHVIVPSLGEAIHEVRIVRWLVPQGGAIDRDAPLVELTTDKIDFVLPSPASGVVTPTVTEGESITIGSVIGQITT